MAIELEELRLRVREFIDTIVRPTEEAMDESNRDEWVINGHKGFISGNLPL